MPKTPRLARILYSALLASACSAAGTAAAQQAVPPIEVPTPEVTAAPSAGRSYALGLGLGYAPDYEGSDDYQFVPLWNLRVGNLYGRETYVQLFGPRLRSNLLPSEHWRLGISGQYIPKRDDVDDRRVDELDSVDAALLLGLSGGYDFLAGPAQDLGVELDARQDVASGNGFLGTLRGFYSSGTTVRVGFSVETTYASEDYMSAYFGVDAEDAEESGLDRYDADAGFKDVALGASVTWRLAQNWSFGLLGRYARLLDDAKDSPVVDDRGSANQFAAGALASFHF